MEKEARMEDDFVLIGEAARIAGRHPMTMLEYEKRGLLPPAQRQPITNNRMWPRRVIEELADKLEMKQTAPA